MDFEHVDALPPVVGVIAGTLGCDVPIYGRRVTWLPIPRRWFDQVRVRGFGGLYWINTRVVPC